MTVPFSTFQNMVIQPSQKVFLLDLSSFTSRESKLVDGRLLNPTQLSIERIYFKGPPSLKVILVWNGMQLFLRSKMDKQWIEYDCSSLSPKSWISLLRVLLEPLPHSVLFVWDPTSAIQLWSVNQHQTLEQKRIFYLGLKGIIRDNNGLIVVLREVKKANYTWGDRNTPLRSSVIVHHCNKRINLKIKDSKDLCQKEGIFLPLSE